MVPPQWSDLGAQVCVVGTSTADGRPGRHVFTPWVGRVYARAVNGARRLGRLLFAAELPGRPFNPGHFISPIYMVGPKAVLDPGGLLFFLKIHFS